MSLALLSSAAVVLVITVRNKREARKRDYFRFYEGSCWSTELSRWVVVSMDRQEDAQDPSGRWEWKENAEHGESTRSNKILTVKKIKGQFIRLPRM
jgi:hypothetical protein